MSIYEQIPEKLYNLINKHFEGLNVEIPIWTENKTKKISTFRQFCDLIETETLFWDKCNSGKTNDIRNHFYTVKKELIQISTMNYNEAELLSIINQLVDKLRRNDYPCLFSITKFGIFIKDIYSDNPIQADAAITYFTDQMDNKDMFIGTNRAFIFDYAQKAYKGYADSQAKALDILSQQYEDNANMLFEEHYNKQKEIDNTYKEFTDNLDNWQEEQKTKFDNFMEANDKRVIHLEETYKEKLKLEAPVTEWNKLYEHYRFYGRVWCGISVVVAAILMWILTAILYNTPQILKISVKDFTLESLKGTLILAVIVSLGIYLLRLFIKLSTSAFHLSRDAKERYQLTYIYLSLMKDNEVSESERSIVYQSLFSRADTGLLKGDAGPSMPDGLGLLQQIAKLLKS